MQDCTSCGTTNRPGAAFCLKCGTRLASATSRPIAGLDATQTGTVLGLSDESLRCAGCGAVNRPGDNFCKMCGSSIAIARVGSTVQPGIAKAPLFTPVVSQRRRSLQVSLVAFAFVGALLLGGGAFVLLTGSNDSASVESTIGETKVESTDQKDVDTTTIAGVPPVVGVEPAATTTVSAQVIPTTFATSAVPELLPGDLGLSLPMSKPPCDDTYITIVASALNPDTNASVLTSVLERYPGSNYLKTSETCPSLRPSLNGEDIYVVYFGPYLTSSEACAARSKGPTDAYVRILSLTVPDTHRVTC